MDSITQPNEHTFSWTWTLKSGCRRHRRFTRYWSRNLFLKKRNFPEKKIYCEMGKSRKARKTLAHTKEQSPLLPLSGNLQENLESSPCPSFSRATRRRRHRFVRGTRIQQLVLSSPRWVCVFHLCVLPLPVLTPTASRGYTRHLHDLSRATSKLFSFLVLRSLCMTSDCCRLLCRIVSPAQTVSSTSGDKSPQISESDKTRLEM